MTTLRLAQNLALFVGMALAPAFAHAQVPSAPAGSPQSFAWVGPQHFPLVDFGRLMPGDPVPGMPGKIFRHTLLETGGGGWYIADAPVVNGGPVSQVLNTAPDSDEVPPPPTQDEWDYTDAYTGVGSRVPVLIRAANPDRWFVQGGSYVAPYAEFRMTILQRVKLADGNWAWIGQVTQSGGTPQRGTILSYPLYGDRGLWLTEDELSSAANQNMGR